MNYVEKTSYKIGGSYLLKDLIGYQDKDKTAFIGVCGGGPEGLYLITYNSIFLASSPKSDYWDYGNCPVTVKEFVDVRIEVVD